MTIEHYIEQRTADIQANLQKFRDNIARLRRESEEENERLLRERSAISMQRVELDRLKHQLREAEDQFEAAQRRFEEIERQRRAALEQLSACQAAKDALRRQYSDAGQAIDRLQRAANRISDAIDRIEAQIQADETDHDNLEKRRIDALVGALDAYLNDCAMRLKQAYEGDEERKRRETIARAFREAQQTDPDVQALCGQ